MKRTDLAYTAGIIDGEGSIGILPNSQHKSYCLRVEVGSTDEWLPMWLKFAWGGYVYRAERKLPRQTCWLWYISSRQAAEFLTLILPYLKLKREQAQIALRFQSRRRGYGGKQKPKGEFVLDQADAILIKSMHQRKGIQKD